MFIINFKIKINNKLNILGKIINNDIISFKVIRKSIKIISL